MTQAAVWTVEAYHRAEQEGKLDETKYYEILDGELIEVASPKLMHQWVVQTLFFLIKQFAMARDLGIPIISPFDVILSQTQKPQPDLIFVSKSQMNIVDLYGWVNGAPNLLVEVSSPSTKVRDRKKKRRIYEEAGVLEYWLIDVKKQTAQVLKLENGRYVEHKLPTGRLESAGVLAGFSIELTELFSYPVGINRAEASVDSESVEDEE